MRTAGALAPYKDLESLARSHIAAQSKLGVPQQQLARVPTKADDAAGWNDVYDKLGRPKTAGDYKLDAKALEPFGIKADGEQVKGFRETAHKLGLSSTQFEGVLGWYLQDAGAAAARINQDGAAATARGIEGLKTEWGAAYEEKVHLANVAMGTYGDGDFKKLLEIPIADGVRLGDHPAVVKTFAKLGGTLSEDQIKVAMEGRTGGAALTPDEANRKINANYSNPEFQTAYQNAAHPKHAEAVEEMRKLFEFANPGG